MSSTAEKLREAKALIEDPGRWCQEAYAMNAKGEIVNANDPAAVRWCAVGACDQVGSGWAIAEYLYRITRGTGTSVVHTNDTLGHEAVMKLFDRAIELAEQSDE